MKLLFVFAALALVAVASSSLVDEDAFAADSSLLDDNVQAEPAETMMATRSRLEKC